MIDITSLVVLCETALAAGSKAVKAYANKRLSGEEKELLIAAAQTGEFFLIEAANIPGTWVRAGRRQFADLTDPAYAATYLEAFRSLCERGLIVHEGEGTFMLSGSGFRKARQLANVKN